MATLDLTFQDIYDRVADFLSVSTSDSTALSRVKDITHRGFRNFLYPIHPRTGFRHIWTFLRVYSTINTTNGQWKYALPSDFGRMISGEMYYDESKGYPRVMKRSPEQIMDYRSGIITESWPEIFAVQPVKRDEDQRTRWELWLYPTPHSSFDMGFFYQANPLKPEDTTDYLVGMPEYQEALVESCLAVAEQQDDDVIGIHTTLAESKVDALILSDDNSSSDSCGFLNDSRDHDWFNCNPRGLLIDYDLLNVYPNS